jgi:hypothetical protein
LRVSQLSYLTYPNRWHFSVIYFIIWYNLLWNIVRMQGLPLHLGIVSRVQERTPWSPFCCLCQEGETVCHILAICPIHETQRKNFGFKSANFNFQDILEEDNPETLTQFILDPTSINLKKRVNISDPITHDLFKISSDMWNYVHSERMKQLNELSKRRIWPCTSSLTFCSLHCNDLTIKM